VTSGGLPSRKIHLDDHTISHLYRLLPEGGISKSQLSASWPRVTSSKDMLHRSRKPFRLSAGIRLLPESATSASAEARTKCECRSISFHASWHAFLLFMVKRKSEPGLSTVNRTPAELKPIPDDDQGQSALGRKADG